MKTLIVLFFGIYLIGQAFSIRYYHNQGPPKHQASSTYPKYYYPPKPPVYVNHNRIIKEPYSSRPNIQQAPFKRKPSPNFQQFPHPLPSPTSSVLPEKPWRDFQSSSLELKPHLHNEFIHSSLSPPSLFNSVINPIFDDDKSPIHTIPAPNLNPSDRPANFNKFSQNLQFEIPINTHEPELNNNYSPTPEFNGDLFTGKLLNPEISPQYEVTKAPTYYAPDPDPSLPSRRVPPTNDPYSIPSEVTKIPSATNVEHEKQLAQLSSFGDQESTLTAQELFTLLNGLHTQEGVNSLSQPQLQQHYLQQSVIPLTPINFNSLLLEQQYNKETLPIIPNYQPIYNLPNDLHTLNFHDSNLHDAIISNSDSSASYVQSNSQYDLQDSASSKVKNVQLYGPNDIPDTRDVIPVYPSSKIDPRMNIKFSDKNNNYTNTSIGNNNNFNNIDETLYSMTDSLTNEKDENVKNINSEMQISMNNSSSNYVDTDYNNIAYDESSNNISNNNNNTIGQPNNESQQTIEFLFINQ